MEPIPHHSTHLPEHHRSQHRRHDDGRYLSVVGEGIALSFPTPSLTLVDGQEISLAGQTSGSPVRMADISELPAGLSFGQNNGTIWGTPEAVMQMTEYSVQVISGTSTDTEALFIRIVMDTEGDSDLDGWKDDTRRCATPIPIISKTGP